MLCTKVIDLARAIKYIKQTVDIPAVFIQRQFLLLKKKKIHLENGDIDLPYLIEIRWLSCSGVLGIFRELKDAIEICFDPKERDISVLLDLMASQYYSSWSV